MKSAKDMKTQTFCNSCMGEASTSAGAGELEARTLVPGDFGSERLNSLRLLDFRDSTTRLRSLKSDFRFRGLDSFEILFDNLSSPMSKISRASLKGAKVLLLWGSSSSSTALIFAGVSEAEGVVLSNSRDMEFDGDLNCH
jgi:hypothetical protein